ncbi:MAG TPA: methyltransferase domain-containing protein [Dyadobacter sp.]|jgi:2-polyprenyl-3-methyl-5-hydroxy-6-metoxy-1,4-benzoquinol methylase|nr:methyltransferase domain-containing protein [Dyadobacter sp.]
MFSQRSSEKELLDQDNIPVKELYRNLRELDFINHWLGGYSISFSALKKVMKYGSDLHLVDIGCGGGDTLKRISTWNSGKRFKLKLSGVDLKSVCIDYARKNLAGHDVSLVWDDYKNIFDHFEHVDIIHACLFCHHLTTPQLVELIRFCRKHNCILIVNDLERNPVAYHLIKALTFVFSKSYLVVNDAPLSVLRGFKKKEWIAILQESGATNYTVANKWAFRHQVIVYPQ